MKKLIGLILLVISLQGFSQTISPAVTPGFNGRSTLPVEDKIVSARQHLNLPRYNDSTQANTYNAVNGLDTCGALYYDYSLSAIMFRSCDSSRKHWVQIIPSGGGGGGLSAWLVGGNYNVLSDARGNAGFGTLTGNGIYFKTNATTRLYLPKTGLGTQTAGTVGIGYDPTDSNRLTTFSATSSAWSLTGNAGTVAGTNFLGTTDNVGLMFKTNNIQSGYIDLVHTGSTSFGNSSMLVNAGNFNTGIGYSALTANTSGSSNTADGSLAMFTNTTGSGNSGFGYQSLVSNTSGSSNTGVGVYSLGGNTTGYSNTGVGRNTLTGNQSGHQNTAIGDSSLFYNTGSNNIGIGYNSGKYDTSYSNKLFINSLDRSNKGGDTTKSIIYGLQNTTATNQQLYFNSQVYLPYANSGVGTKAVRINPGTGLITYADTTTATGTPAGNYGDVQLNRNSAFATPASDSLIFASGGLSVKGNLTVSTLTSTRIPVAGASGLLGDFANLTYTSGNDAALIVKGTSGGGLRMGSYPSNATYGAIYSNNVTPSTTNEIIASDGAQTLLNSSTNTNLALNGAVALTVANATGANVGIGTGTSVAASAMLEVTSTAKGFLPPRMTGAQAEAISSPADGLMIYCNNGNGSTVNSTGWWGYSGGWTKIH